MDIKEAMREIRKVWRDRYISNREGRRNSDKIIDRIEDRAEVADELGKNLIEALKG